MKLVLALIGVAVLFVSEFGFGPCPITGPTPSTYAAMYQDPQKAAPAGAFSPAADKGRFKVLLNGQHVGTEDFEIVPFGKDWVVKSTVSLKPPAGDSLEVHGTLRLAGDGSPISYEWSTSAPKKASASIQFRGNVAKTTLNLDGATKPFEQENTFQSSRVAIIDNNIYSHYAVLARLYDWSARGQQSVQALIPQDLTPGTIKLEAGGSQQVEGANLELLRATTESLEIDLYLDSSHRLMRLSVPNSKVLVVRE